MDANDYRRKIEQSIAKASARPAKSRRMARSTNPGDVVANTKMSAKSRAEALGRLMRDEGPDVVPRTALERLADPKESAQVRLAALRLLQQKQIFSPIAADWRPDFIEALRAAIEQPATRAAALEALSLLKDRPTQALLLLGIQQPRQALVPVHVALRLLSADVHADVIAAARKLIAAPRIRKDKAASVQATRILGADPKSLPALEKVLGSDTYALDARRAAATAISHLSPGRLEALTTPSRAPRRARKRGVGAEPATAGKRSAKPQGALAKHIATLRKVRS
jgi:hypothetical protein